MSKDTVHLQDFSMMTIRQKIENWVTHVTTRSALLLALEDAENRRRESAGTAYYDDGANDLQQRVSVYVQGWGHTTPYWLLHYVKRVTDEADIEFKEYVRLYEKFGGIEPRKKQDFSVMPHKNSDLTKEFK